MATLRRAATLAALMRIVTLAQPASLRAQGVIRDSLPARSLSPVLMVIHGRNETTTNPSGLARDWLAALDRGLTEVGLDPSLIPPADRRFVYYGDVFAKQPHLHEHCSTQSFMVAEADEREEGESLPNGGLRLARDLSWAMPSSWRYGLIMHFTPDTRAYIRESASSCSVRNVLVDSLTTQRGRRIVVLAHSQGALLTYEHMTATEGWGADTLAGFVSVGAQFGFDGLMLRFGAKTRHDGHGIHTPMGLGSVWYNLYDEHDPVAFRMNGRYLGIPGGTELREVRVRNRSEFRHDAVGYLAQPPVALAVADAWCRAYETGQPAACARVKQLVANGGLEDAARRPPDGWAIGGLALRILPIAAYTWVAYRIVR